MNLSERIHTHSMALAICLSALATIPIAKAGNVVLQQPTATFSQTYVADFLVGTAIDGVTDDGLGWSVYENDPGKIDQTSDQTAVFETASEVGFAGGSILTFKLDQMYAAWGQHTLGRFRLSVTTDDRSLFADGLPTGGAVTANWTVLDPDSFVSANGATLSELADHSILASGVVPDTDSYAVTATTSLTGITGIRLELIQDPSLPSNGPGRQMDNGNFILSEFSVDIAPLHPTLYTLLIAGECVRTNGNGRLTTTGFTTRTLVEDCAAKHGLANVSSLRLVYRPDTASVNVVSVSDGSTLCEVMAFDGGQSLANADGSVTERQAFVFLPEDREARGSVRVKVLQKSGGFKFSGQVHFATPATTNAGPKILDGFFWTGPKFVLEKSPHSHESGKTSPAAPPHPSLP